MKKLIVLIMAALTLLSAAACSCGGSGETGGKTYSAIEQETIKLLETTPDGGTVEKDKDGNTIEKDKDGEIVSVKDSDGNSVDIEQYKADYPVVSGKTESSKSSAVSGKTSSKASSSTLSDKTSSKTSSKSSKTSSTSGNNSEDETEEEIPTIVVTMPENPEELEEIPDL